MVIQEKWLSKKSSRQKAEKKFFGCKSMGSLPFVKDEILESAELCPASSKRVFFGRVFGPSASSNAVCKSNGSLANLFASHTQHFGFNLFVEAGHSATILNLLHLFPHHFATIVLLAIDGSCRHAFQACVGGILEEGACKIFHGGWFNKVLWVFFHAVEELLKQGLVSSFGWSTSNHLGGLCVADFELFVVCRRIPCLR